MTSSSNRVQWVFSSSNNQELVERYNQWAKNYEQDIIKDFGWQGPTMAAQFADKYIPKEVRILDAGVGTGLVGQELKKRGYKNMVAMDISRSMLEESRKKKIYQEFHQEILGEPLGFATDSFDAVVSVGVFTPGHAPPSGLDELVRITKSEGFVIFTLRLDIYKEGGFKEKLTVMEEDGHWKLVEASPQFQGLPTGEPEAMHQVWVYKVN